MGIGTKIQDLINNQHLRVTDVARRAQIPVSTLHTIINNDSTRVEIASIHKVATVLGVPLDYFVEGPIEDNIGVNPLVSELNSNPALCELLDTAKDLSSEDIKAVTLIVRKMRGAGKEPDNE